MQFIKIQHAAEFFFLRQALRSELPLFCFIREHALLLHWHENISGHLSLYEEQEG